jgi:DNA repair protein RecO (recombination protein O)
MKTVSNGIVLKNTDYGETSVISRVFTDNNGIKSFLVKGARGQRKKSPYLQPLAIVEIEYHNHPAKDLLVATSIKCSEPYHEIPLQLNKSFVCLFLNELIYESLNTGHHDADLYEFMRTHLLMFDLEPWNPNFHLYFMVSLTRYYGFFPLSGTSDRYFSIEEGCFSDTKPASQKYLDGKLSKALFHFCNYSWKESAGMKLTRSERNELTHLLVLYYRLHNPDMRAIRSLDVLSEVLDA